MTVSSGSIAIVATLDGWGVGFAGSAGGEIGFVAGEAALAYAGGEDGASG